MNHQCFKIRAVNFPHLQRILQMPPGYEIDRRGSRKAQAPCADQHELHDPTRRKYSEMSSNGSTEGKACQTKGATLADDPVESLKQGFGDAKCRRSFSKIAGLAE